MLSVTNSPAGLYLNLGMVVGIALNSISCVVVLGAVAQVVPEQKRSSTFGIVTAAGSYTLVWVMAILLGVRAAILHLPVAGRPIEKIPEPIQNDMPLLKFNRHRSDAK